MVNYTLKAIALMFVATGCASAAKPVSGFIYSDTQFGLTATNASGGKKEGKACSKSILGWVATGDATIEAAKKAGGISTVSAVDATSKNILGFYAEYCTVVTGN